MKLTNQPTSQQVNELVSFYRISKLMETHTHTQMHSLRFIAKYPESVSLNQEVLQCTTCCILKDISLPLIKKTHNIQIQIHWLSIAAVLCCVSGVKSALICIAIELKLLVYKSVHKNAYEVLHFTYRNWFSGITHIFLLPVLAHRTLLAVYHITLHSIQFRNIHFISLSLHDPMYRFLQTLIHVLC